MCQRAVWQHRRTCGLHLGTALAARVHVDACGCGTCGVCYPLHWSYVLQACEVCPQVLSCKSCVRALRRFTVGQWCGYMRARGYEPNTIKNKACNACKRRPMRMGGRPIQGKRASTSMRVCGRRECERQAERVRSHQGEGTCTYICGAAVRAAQQARRSGGRRGLRRRGGGACSNLPHAEGRRRVRGCAAREGRPPPFP